MSSRLASTPVAIDKTPAETQASLAAALAGGDPEDVRKCIMDVYAVCHDRNAWYRVRRTALKVLRQAKQRGDEELVLVTDCLHRALGHDRAAAMIERFGSA